MLELGPAQPLRLAGRVGPDAHRFLRRALAVVLLDPRSSGTVLLRSSDPSVPPAIDPRYLTDPGDDDESALLRGLRLARRVLVQEPLASFVDAEILPGADARSDDALRARAAKVVPGGMHGHMKASFLPANFPQFFARGDGCRIWDVDGAEYLDLMCSWGPILLGHRHPAVEAAVAAQLAEGDVLAGPSARMVELAEVLVDQVAHADWAMFCKNGTDATTLGVTVARSATGRRKVLVARGS